MPLFFLIVGVALLGLDRAIDRNTVVKYQHTLDYYIYYYRPIFQRIHFFVIIIAVMAFSILVNYLIFGEVNIISQILILPLIIFIIYCLIMLILIFDYLVLREKEFLYFFYIMERDFIQTFSLAFFFPFIYLALILKILLNIFIYPSRKIFIFNSFAGLLGFILCSGSLIMFFL